jgi:hypothetical protein
MISKCLEVALYFTCLVVTCFAAARPRPGASLFYLQCNAPAPIFPFSTATKWGFLDVSGKVAVPAQFQSISPFSDGVARVHVDNHIAFVDGTGRVVLRTNAVQAQDFSEGLAAVEVKGKWGFIDKVGNLAIPAIFDYVSPFREGLAAVKENGAWKYIDTSGRAIIPEAAGWDHGYLSPFHDGLAVVYSMSGRAGYIDRRGKWAIKPVFRSAQDFYEHLAAANVRGKWGYIDRKGVFQIPPRYIEAGPFSGGVAAVRVAESPAIAPQVGFVKKSGILSVSPEYQNTLGFCRGYAAVQQGGKWGYINTAGSTTVAPQFYQASNFSGALARVVLRNAAGQLKEAYIDKQGHPVWISSEPIHSID